MPRRAALAAEQHDDDLVVRALARGDRHAVGRLLEAHGDAIYGLLRMALPEVSDVEKAFYETFLKAAQRADEPGARVDPATWLKSIALEEIADRAVPAPPVPLHGDGDRVPEVKLDAGPKLNDADALAGVTDRALAVLVRTLEPRSRQALILSLNCELDEAGCAAIIGCRPEEVGQLRQEAFAGLRMQLAEHERREAALRRQMERGTAHHLRPVHTMPGGIAVLKGDRVYVQSAPSNIVMAIVKVLRRFVERLVKAQDSRLDEDDVGGGARPGKAPEATPTAKPMAKPELTPSLQTYRTPKHTSGTASYRHPKATPSTQRLSSPRRALPAGASWSSARLWRR
jgi:DNA-directed RNA polymerase specialized sigma24 family protein